VSTFRTPVPTHHIRQVPQTHLVAIRAVDVAGTALVALGLNPHEPVAEVRAVERHPDSANGDAITNAIALSTPFKVLYPIVSFVEVNVIDNILAFNHWYVSLSY
jgi:hypothetical protein